MLSDLLTQYLSPKAISRRGAIARPVSKLRLRVLASLGNSVKAEVRVGVLHIEPGPTMLRAIRDHGWKLSHLQPASVGLELVWALTRGRLDGRYLNAEQRDRLRQAGRMVDGEKRERAPRDIVREANLQKRGALGGRKLRSGRSARTAALGVADLLLSGPPLSARLGAPIQPDRTEDK